MNPYQKVAFYTLGCKLNFSETSTLARNFVDAGFARVDFNEQPDVFVINTCSVTENADRKCRNVVNRARRVNPEAYIAVVGCYAQLKPKEIAGIPGVNLVLGAGEKFNILDHIDRSAKQPVIKKDDIKYVRDFVPGFSSNDRTRSYLKVQDGCDYFCSFCTIPLARGRSRSADVAETVKQARKAADAGAREIVLTGVNIGDFGKDGGEDFFDLICALDAEVAVDRFRISSIEPNLLSDAIIDWIPQSEKFVPHLHIPLQSGSDAMLKDMRRRYDTDLYTERVQRIKAIMPDACIGVDVITGFPGETQAEFDITQRYLADLPVSYLHVFTYSERANTTAVRKSDAIPVPERQQRSKQLQQLSLRKKRAFYDSQIGKTGLVLFEHENKDGHIEGFSENYIRCTLTYDSSYANRVARVRYKGLNSDGLMEARILQWK